MINSYGSVFFKEFKYLSDSRRRWRESVIEMIKSGEYNRLHILTHAFWYHDEEEDISRTVRAFVNIGCMDRYMKMKNNITDIASIMRVNEVLS